MCLLNQITRVVNMEQIVTAIAPM